MQQSTAEEPEGSERNRGAVIYPLPDGVIVERDVRVEVRDGVHLSATVCRPAGDGRFPVVMCVTVYGKDLGPDEYSTLPKIKASGNAVGTMHISDATTWEVRTPASGYRTATSWWSPTLAGTTTPKGSPASTRKKTRRIMPI